MVSGPPSAKNPETTFRQRPEHPVVGGRPGPGFRLLETPANQSADPAGLLAPPPTLSTATPGQQQRLDCNPRPSNPFIVSSAPTRAFLPPCFEQLRHQVSLIPLHRVIRSAVPPRTRATSRRFYSLQPASDRSPQNTARPAAAAAAAAAAAHFRRNAMTTRDRGRPAGGPYMPPPPPPPPPLRCGSRGLGRPV